MVASRYHGPLTGTGVSLNGATSRSSFITRWAGSTQKWRLAGSRHCLAASISARTQLFQFSKKIPIWGSDVGKRSKTFKKQRKRPKTVKSGIRPFEIRKKQTKTSEKRTRPKIGSEIRRKASEKRRKALGGIYYSDLPSGCRR